jgi:metallo-beta-lactamase class B
MRVTSIRLKRGAVLAVSLGTVLIASDTRVGSLSAQAQLGTPETHIAAARQAAGQDHTAVFNRTCGQLTPPPANATRPARAPGPPPRASWYAEPAKVFDNLYFLGQTEYSVWAVTTSQGIILVDTIFDYSVEAEVADGLRKLGLDPTQIKYAIVSHGHSDHSGGAKFLQDKYGTKIVLSAADWELLEKGRDPAPRRDVVAADGMKLTLGDTTLTLYVTPGHTLGTISTIIPVKDNGKTRIAAEWGGTAFNWVTNPSGYITPDRPPRFWFDIYSKSAQRFRDIVAKENAEIIIANHTDFDGSKRHLPVLAKRKPTDPNPYVIGKEGVLRYMTVADECAKAGLAGAK